MKNKAAQELGSLGGKATKARHGIEHYRRLTANMNRKKALKKIVVITGTSDKVGD